ncbi:glycosyltransferase family 39 protein [Paraglaciecola sp.]|uniref:glycosyltransferase family 39 protein n=1 Tax=Paraglaciecola sp. TaxID=1920173 RepID=UPI003264852D
MKSNIFWKLLSLVLFGLVIVAFSYIKSADEANSRFTLSWGHSQWITTQEPSPVGYFRASVELDSKATRAQLQIATTDEFSLYVNGFLVDEKVQKSMLATGVFDVSTLLNVGENIIAVKVKRSTYPAIVGLRYELTALDEMGRKSTYFSTQKDKASHLLPQQTSNLYWYSNGVDDAEWLNTKSWQGSDDVSMIGFDPNLLMGIEVPETLLVSSPQSWRVSTQTEFQYEATENAQVWFTIASDSPYEVAVNGISLGVFPVNDRKLNLKSIQAKLADGTNNLRIDFLNSGNSVHVAGGIIIDSAKGTDTIYLDRSWLFTEVTGSTTDVFTELHKADLKSNVKVAKSSLSPDYFFVVDESFVAPKLIQKAPWLFVLKFVVVALFLSLIFKALGLSIKEQLDATVLANLVALLCLLCAWFMAQDVRFDARQIFSDGAFDLVLVIWALLVAISMTDQWRVKGQDHTAKLTTAVTQSLNLNHLIYWLLVTSAIVLTFVMRFEGLDLRALTVDEATIAGFARGVIERGYPYLMVGGMEVELATYELVPYFLAASIKVFGYGDFALRFPALMFSTMTCGAIIYCGTKWFGRLSGLIAGLLFAVSPWAIYWGQNCFHPAQTQFFNLIALIVFYRLLKSDQISIKLAVLSACMFAFSYLSWEGAGLVLPIMAIVAIIIRWRQWQWFMQMNLWIAALLILFVIAFQGIRRMLLQSPFVMVGFGKSDLATPKLTFTDSSYEPWYYLQNFFFTESHFALSLFFIVGFILIFYDKKLSFVVLFVLMAYLSLTNLLGYYNAHYFYFVLPAFLIAVAAIFVKLLMLIQAHTSAKGLISWRMQGAVVGMLMAFVLFIPTSSGVLHMYRLMAGSIDGLRVDYRESLSGMDGREVSSALRKYKREGDLVLTSIPLVTEHYIEEKGDYFVQTITDRKVVYDTVKKSPYYVDKFVGNPVLRSKQELQDVLQRNDRVFFVAAPVNGLTRIIDEETLDYINQNMRVLEESYDSRLYIWER